VIEAGAAVAAFRAGNTLVDVVAISISPAAAVRTHQSLTPVKERLSPRHAAGPVQRVWLLTDVGKPLHHISAHDGLGSAAERHRRAAIRFQRPEFRARAAVARSGSYVLPVAMAPAPLRPDLRGSPLTSECGRHGNRSPSIMSSSSLSRLQFSSVRPRIINQWPRARSETGRQQGA